MATPTLYMVFVLSICCDAGKWLVSGGGAPTMDKLPRMPSWCGANLLDHLLSLSASWWELSTVTQYTAVSAWRHTPLLHRGGATTSSNQATYLHDHVTLGTATWEREQIHVHRLAQGSQQLLRIGRQLLLGSVRVWLRMTTVVAAASPIVPAVTTAHTVADAASGQRAAAV